MPLHAIDLRSYANACCLVTVAWTQWRTRWTGTCIVPPGRNVHSEQQLTDSCYPHALGFVVSMDAQTFLHVEVCKRGSRTHVHIRTSVDSKGVVFGIFTGWVTVQI